MKAIRNGPHNFESWSSNEEDTLAGTPSPNFHTRPMGGRLSLDKFNVSAPSRRWVFNGTTRDKPATSP
ncbi:hypothetical protein TNCV_1956691 [Trichonephila clavipes]|nr:hypothetical protein TNCV_1956691 [Trichonephila clavipes]